MQIDSNYQKRCSNPYFGIKVSKSFIDVAHNYYNYGVGSYKKQNIYRFNEKVKEFENFGFDNYTLEYERWIKDGNMQHRLVAIKDGTNGKKRVKITKNKTALYQVINRFLSMNQSDFKSNFFKNKSKKG